MTAHVTATVEFPSRLIAGLRTQLDVTSKRRVLRELENVFRGMLNPAFQNRGHLRVCIADACASVAVTCTRSAAVDATDTITIAGTTLSVVASPASTVQFAKGASDTDFAANLAAEINGNATLQKLVRATSWVGVCTITCVFPGPIGNLIALSEVGNGMALGSATLASGASDEVDNYEFGYTPAT